MNRPDDRHELDHASAAADHMLALVVAANPASRVTAGMHDATVELVRSIVRALTVGTTGGAR